MNQPAHCEVLECASPLALSDLVRGRKSGRGLPQSKTLARQRPPRRGSWSQCVRERKEAFHEPERGAPAPPGPALQGHVDRAGLEPRAPIPRLMVPMYAQERKEALHEPPAAPPGFGLRQSSGAFRSGPRGQKRQRAAAVQDARASEAASLQFRATMPAPRRKVPFPKTYFL